jgi:hypothetical protein
VKINLDITYPDGRVKSIVANHVDMIAFEDTYDKSAAVLGEARLGYMYWLAWQSEKRRGETTLGYEQWLETVDQVKGSDKDPKSEG